MPTITEAKRAFKAAKAIQQEANEILKPQAANEMPKSESALLTVHEVAVILRVDDATVRRWVKQEILEALVLPHVKERQIYRIRRRTLDALLGQVQGATA